jgi:hypothetical protein
VFGIVFVIYGVWFLAGREWIARKGVEFHRLMGIPLVGKKTVGLVRLASLFMGILFLAIGMALVFHLISIPEPNG